jgi:methylphosphotriester-DNA--protein-cysteine methyltransferase
VHRNDPPALSSARVATRPYSRILHGVSVCGLQQGFRDYLGIIPLEYLRDIRMARVRGDLLAADPQNGTSIT